MALSLKSKFVVVVTAAMAVTLGLYNVADIGTREREAVGYDIARAELVADIIKNGLVTIMVEGRAKELRRFIETMTAYDLKAVRLYAPGGRVIASNIPGEGGLSLAPPEFSGGPEVRVAMEGGARMFNVTTPFYNEHSCRGCHAGDGDVLSVLSVSISSDRASNIVRVLREGALYAFLLTLLVTSVLVGTLTSVVVVRPLRRVLDRARRGRLGPPPGPEGLEGIKQIDADVIEGISGEVDALLGELAAERARCAAADAARDREIKETEKMASVGELAATVAHEIKNPLAGISGAIQVLAEDLPQGDPKREVIAEVLSEIDRLDKSVRDLLCFARLPEPSRMRTPLGAIVERAVSYVTARPESRHIRVTIENDCSGVYVMVDPEQIHQVLCNVMRHSLKAMPEGGSISIGSFPAAERGFYAIRVADTSRGLPQEELATIFKPDCGSKSLEVGLGLAIGKSIVEKHGGKIGVESRAGDGTAFTITLPTEGEDA